MKKSGIIFLKLKNLAHKTIMLLIIFSSFCSLAKEEENLKNTSKYERPYITRIKESIQLQLLDLFNDSKTFFNILDSFQLDINYQEKNITPVI